MQCAKCGFYNQPDSQFCVKCGIVFKGGARPASKPTESTPKALLYFVGGLFVLATIVVIITVATHPKPGESTTQPVISKAPVPTAPQQPPAKPLEYQLAVINAGGFVADNDVSVNRFRYLLETLQKQTAYTQQQIADANVMAVNTLHNQYGKNIKLLDFMEGTLKPLQVKAKVDYKEIVAAMIVLIGRQ